MVKKYFFYIILLNLFFSCQEPLDVIHLRNWLNDNPKFKNSKAIVIIPNSGCDGCISSIEEFIAQNFSKTNKIKYIFTEINSFKVLKMRFENISKNDNIHFDIKNKIQYSILQKSFYPCILLLNNNKINKVIYISPSTPNSLQYLKAIINE